MVRAEGLRFSYGDREVLRDVSLRAEEHEVVAVMGPNGSGKTTLLRCLDGLLKPKSGMVTLLGRDLRRYSRRERARRMAYVPQRGEPGRLTAFDAVLLGRRPHMGFRVSRRDLSLVDAALRSLGIRHLAMRPTTRMSGGELQKVGIARALVGQPGVMLLDEPTASLDLRSQLSITRLIRTIVRGHPMCAVMTMHDLNTALRYADRFVFLRGGEVHASVDADGVTPAIVEEVYGVPVKVGRHEGRPFVVPLEPEAD